MNGEFNAPAGMLDTDHKSVFCGDRDACARWQVGPKRLIRICNVAICKMVGCFGLRGIMVLHHGLLLWCRPRDVATPPGHLCVGLQCIRRQRFAMSGSVGTSSGPSCPV